MTDLAKLSSELKKLADKKQAEHLQRFFKTAPGQYGAGDVFLGIKVPIQRQIAQKYAFLDLKAIAKLLSNKIHEFRLVGLLILTTQYQKAQSQKTKDQLAKFYLKNTKHINNWDLVDLSVYKILGDWLLDKKEADRILNRLAASSNLWERRLAIIATFAFIRRGQADKSIMMAKKLLNDPHDLIHKAVGWTLREVGWRVDRKILLKFLDEYASRMPRTALRYALEHLTAGERKYYLNK
ncbi:MAG: DNA alkylation repair protein [Patescibacteria group bacterium]|jgi:3-methyladenine DNA glycosylase AlkD